MKTTWDDTNNPNCEHRNYTVKSIGMEPPSNKIYYIDCPFCKTEIKAYVWSLSGGGKRCECGALLGGRGSAYKLKPGV